MVDRHRPVALHEQSTAADTPRTIASATITAAWGAALVIAFLAHRGSDVGQLAATVRLVAITLVNDKLVHAATLAHAAVAVAIAAAIVGSWIGLGDALTRLTRGRLGIADIGTGGRALAVAQRAGVGAGVSSLVWFGLGVAGAFTPIVAIVVTLGGLVLFVVSVRWHAPVWRTRARSHLSVIERTAVIAIAVPVTLAAVGALAPPIAKDALIYHRALPKAFVAGGGLVDVPLNIASFFALGAEMHGVWATLLGGVLGPRVAEMAFGAVEFAFFPLVLVAVFGWVKANGLDRAWALVAAALVAAIPTSYHVAASAYVDLTLAFFALLAVEAAADFWATGRRSALMRLAAFLGFALAVKHTAMFLIVPMPLLILLRARREERSGGGTSAARNVLVCGAIALVGAGLIGGVWYARTWVRTGSPFFPFYMNVWPGEAPGWDRERSMLIQGLLSAYGGEGKGAIDYLITPWKLSVLGQPEDATYYEGVLGIAFLFGLPLILWAAVRRALPGAAAIAVTVAAILYGQWLVSVQGLRYLMPVFPLLAFGIVAAGEPVAAWLGWSRSAVRWVMLAATLPGHLVVAAWFLQLNPVRAVLGGETRTAYLERQLDYYRYYEIVNDRLPPSSRIWLIDMRRDTYHIERPYVADYLFEDYMLRKWVESAHDVDEIRGRARRAGITHVLVRHDLLFDPARSPIVDDRRPAEVNDEKMKLMRAFLSEGTVLRGDAKFRLLELPAGGSR